MVELRQVRRQPDSSLQVEVEALCRVRIKGVAQEEPCLTSEIEEIEEIGDSAERDTDALMRHLSELFTHYASLNNKVPQDAPEHIRAARNPGYMADLLAAHLLSDVHERQRVLEVTDQPDRLQYMA